MYSSGTINMDQLKQDEQLEHTYSSYVRIQDIAQNTCQRRWTIGNSGEKGSGISVLAARHDDDEFSWDTLLKFFLSSPFAWWCLLIILASICRFPLLWAFWFFLGLVVLFLLSCVVSQFSLWAWHIFYVEFHSYILTVYSHCLYQGFQYFFIFCKQCDWSFPAICKMLARATRRFPFQ